MTREHVKPNQDQLVAMDAGDIVGTFGKNRVLGILIPAIKGFTLVELHSGNGSCVGGVHADVLLSEQLLCEMALMSGVAPGEYLEVLRHNPPQSCVGTFDVAEAGVVLSGKDIRQATDMELSAGIGARMDNAISQLARLGIKPNMSWDELRKITRGEDEEIQETPVPGI